MDVKLWITARLEDGKPKATLHGAATFWIDEEGHERKSVNHVDIPPGELEGIGKELQALLDKYAQRITMDTEVMGYQGYATAKLRGEIQVVPVAD